MKRLLLPLLAAIALPTTVNATNYVECEAIQNVVNRSAEMLLKDWPSSMKEYKKQQQEIYDRAIKDAKKRGCYYIQ